MVSERRDEMQENEIELKIDARRLTEYLLPRFLELVALRRSVAAVKTQRQEIIGELVRPLFGFVSYDLMREAFSYTIVLVHLCAHEGNLSHAARTLGIHRSTLMRTIERMHRAGIDYSPTFIESLYPRNQHA